MASARIPLRFFQQSLPESVGQSRYRSRQMRHEAHVSERAERYVQKEEKERAFGVRMPHFFHSGRRVGEYGHRESAHADRRSGREERECGGRDDRFEKEESCVPRVSHQLLHGTAEIPEKKRVSEEMEEIRVQELPNRRTYQGFAERTFPELAVRSERREIPVARDEDVPDERTENEGSGQGFRLECVHVRSVTGVSCLAVRVMAVSPDYFVGRILFELRFRNIVQKAIAAQASMQAERTCPMVRLP